MSHCFLCWSSRSSFSVHPITVRAVMLQFKFLRTFCYHLLRPQTKYFYGYFNLSCWTIKNFVLSELSTLIWCLHQALTMLYNFTKNNFLKSIHKNHKNIKINRLFKARRFHPYLVAQSRLVSIVLLVVTGTLSPTCDVSGRMSRN